MKTFPIGSRRLGALLFPGLLWASLLAGPAPARAGDAPAAQVSTEVKRNKVHEAKHPSLRFLRDNRMFIRGQLDRLRLLTTSTTTGRAEPIDDRLLRLQELAAAIAAARDTVAVAAAETARRELLDSVTRLGELEVLLDLMELLAADQRTRLQELEADFLGRQETALVVLIRGLPAGDIPGGLTFAEEGDVLAVPLAEADRLALRQGGVAQILHRFVEPREHTYTLGFSGSAWDSLPGVEVPVTATRDRITFLELDLSNLSPRTAAVGLDARTWTR